MRRATRIRLKDDVCLKIFKTDGNLSEFELKSKTNDLFKEVLSMSDLENENVLKVYGLSVDNCSSPVIGKSYS